MKDREVIETLNDMKGVFGERGHSQYSLYSIDRAIAAIEKQIPVKLIGKSGDTNMSNMFRNTKDITLDLSSFDTSNVIRRYSGHYLCPTCNKMYREDEIVPNYCQGCGQKFNLD